MAETFRATERYRGPCQDRGLPALRGYCRTPFPLLPRCPPLGFRASGLPRRQSLFFLPFSDAGRRGKCPRRRRSRSLCRDPAGSADPDRWHRRDRSRKCREAPGAVWLVRSGTGHRSSSLRGSPQVEHEARARSRIIHAIRARGRALLAGGKSFSFHGLIFKNIYGYEKKGKFNGDKTLVSLLIGSRTKYCYGYTCIQPCRSKRAAASRSPRRRIFPASSAGAREARP